jgi:predicted adenylyl cyclase CyaB
MPANIEIKARVCDLARLRQRAEALSDTPVEVVPQEDTFFRTSQGRLKLRKLSPVHGQLVYYERTDTAGPKRSEYFVAEISEPEALKTALASALGVRGLVRKTRYLYRVGQTRIHLDLVDGLGQFLELEVVLRPEQSDSDGQEIAKALMMRLSVAESDLLEGAYIDLIESKMVCQEGAREQTGG